MGLSWIIHGDSTVKVHLSSCGFEIEYLFKCFLMGAYEHIQSEFASDQLKGILAVCF